MIADETKPEDFRNERGGDHSHIKGWGIDRDPKNDPTYPLKHRTDEEIKGYSWERPEQQPVNIEVLKSVERPNIPAVFGNTLPPSGLSGELRRLAFKYSESSYGRWLPLVMADRINEIEGIIDDLKNGHVPNIFAEKGIKSEWKYNRKNFILKSTVTLAAAAGVFLYLTRDREDD
ncbi:hypothetical protein [Salinimicrobium oceani]|uniref:Uncharacterized protein n=1 Tax=Salinimicrobium oceani TaxID=2722702 RepID=A0ABX1CXY6_9FLAO|nr:hypothetical protein [Salinimicrobium oceani]NJW53118.1 hypothetical protein [Salinimicrobium oceani]